VIPQVFTYLTQAFPVLTFAYVDDSNNKEEQLLSGCSTKPEKLKVNYSLCNTLPCNLPLTVSKINVTQKDKKTDEGKEDERSSKHIPVQNLFILFTLF